MSRQQSSTHLKAKENESLENVTRWTEPRRLGVHRTSDQQLYQTILHHDVIPSEQHRLYGKLAANFHLYLTNTMYQTFEKLTVSQAVEKFPVFHLTQTFHHNIRNSTPTVPITSQVYPVHLLPFYFFKTHFNIILLPKPMSSRWSYFRFLPILFLHSFPLSINVFSQ